ncbi:MAG: 16S rRNA (adenine(1518)-N(6)/adenine(1519)-N(6))-dimethyltransferase RsmA [Clostridia bacterium]|nr:16S rRNA (adenine(1518)-N(6)/adenine(1519)-N(6))-dimethyltransferase RsmA [Clostridia bacterium]
MQYNLTDKTTIEHLIGAEDFRFSKSLGQNFIINPDVCPRIAAESGIDRDCGVIEIGPGIGVLTAELCKLAGKVVSIELDTKLAPILKKTLADFENSEVIYADALKTDIPALIEEKFPGMRVCVCANLPYYITTPIIMHLLRNGRGIESITVMVQKEAAARLCAKVGSRESGAITAAVDYYCEAQKLFDVGKNSFMPAPKVDSSVIKLTLREKPPVEVNDEAFFFSVIKAAFGQRRKTALNSLSSGLSLPKSVISQALADCGFETTVRAETMTMEDFAALTQAIENVK